MNRGHLTFPDSATPNEALRSHAETFERLIAALPAGQPWPRGINPATRTHWRRALEGFVGAVEASGYGVDTLPHDFYQSSIVPKITTADFRNANKRETAVLVFLSWLVEQGQAVAELELPVRKRFKPMQTRAAAAAEAAAAEAAAAGAAVAADEATQAAAGHAGGADDDGDEEEDDEDPEEELEEDDDGDTDGDDGEEAAEAAPPPPAEEPPQRERRERTVAPKQNVLHGLKSGVAVQFTRLGPGSTQIHAGKFPFEEVRRLGTMEHFLATVVAPPIAAKLRRDGQETVTFTVALIDPLGEEITSLAQPPITIDVPTETAFQAPPPPAPAAAPAAAPTAAAPASAAQAPAGFVSWPEAIATLEAREERLKEIKARDAISSEKFDALMTEIRSSRDLMMAAAASAKLAAERTQAAQTEPKPVPPPAPADLPRGPAAPEPFERRLAERALDLAMEGLKPNGNGHPPAVVHVPAPAAPARQPNLEDDIDRVVRISDSLRKLTGGGDRVEDKISATLERLLGDKKSPLKGAVEELKAAGELLGIDVLGRRPAEGGSAIATAISEVGKELVKQLPELFGFYYNSRLLGMGIVPPQLSGNDPHRQAAMQAAADATAKAKIPEQVREAIYELLKAEATPEGSPERESWVGMCLISLMESFNQAAGSDPQYHDASRKIGLLLRTKKDAELATYVQQVFQTIGYGSAVDPMRIRRILAIFRKIEKSEQDEAAQAAAEAREELEKQANVEREARAAALEAAKTAPAGLPAGAPEPAQVVKFAPPPPPPAAAAVPAGPDPEELAAMNRAAEEAIANADRAIADALASQEPDLQAAPPAVELVPEPPAQVEAAPEPAPEPAPFLEAAPAAA